MTTALRLVNESTTAHQHDPSIEGYLEWARDLRGLRPNTLRVRRELLTRLAVLLGKPLCDANEDDLLRWERLHVMGRAPETRRTYICHVRAFYSRALRSRLVSTDPTGCLTLPKVPRGLPRPMPEEDLRKIVAAARPKMRLMVLLAAFCGLRCIEISGLHWSDVTTREGAHSLLVREAKGGHERVVLIPSVVMEAMIAHGRRRSGPIFFGTDGRQITAHAVSTGINRKLDKLGIDCTAHQLRHRFATTAYHLTKDIRMVQELLGHTDPKTTARYAAYDKEPDRGGGGGHGKAVGREHTRDGLG